MGPDLIAPGGILISKNDASVPANWPPVQQWHELTALADPACSAAPIQPSQVVTLPTYLRPMRVRSSAGRHRLDAAGPRYLERHGARFVTFAMIGGTVFVAGFALQVVLTTRLHVPAFASYLIQTVLGVEANFLLNRWLTWRDRVSQFWPECVRFNVQRALTTVLNLASYAGLIYVGMNYLLANIILTAAFTLVNYMVGDRFVFPARGEAAIGRRAARDPIAVGRVTKIGSHHRRRPAGQIRRRDPDLIGRHHRRPRRKSRAQATTVRGFGGQPMSTATPGGQSQSAGSSASQALALLAGGRRLVPDPVLASWHRGWRPWRRRS